MRNMYCSIEYVEQKQIWNFSEFCQYQRQAM